MNPQRNTTMSRIFTAAALAVGLAVSSISWAQGKPADDSVYKAWGGKPGIRAVMEDFVPRLEADPRIGRFFRKEGRERLITMLTEQLCQESGGPCKYEGAPMGPVHASMNITKGDFNALVAVLQQSMDAKGIPFSAQNGMLARLAPMHREIISQD
jgi:hemoglobin